MNSKNYPSEKKNIAFRVVKGAFGLRPDQHVTVDPEAVLSDGAIICVEHKGALEFAQFIDGDIVLRDGQSVLKVIGVVIFEENAVVVNFAKFKKKVLAKREKRPLLAKATHSTQEENQ